MKYILDTHLILWYLSEDPNLSTKAKAIVRCTEWTAL